MNSRFFELKDLPSLTMFRDIEGDEPSPVVRLRAIQENSGIDFWLEEDIVFTNRETAKSFIKNYTKEQAKDWIKARIKETE